MRHGSVALALCGALVGCSAQSSTRSVSGQLRVDTSSMKAPVVLAQTADGRVFASPITGGRFAVQVPAEASYRLTLATTKTDGSYSTQARINWPFASGPALWARVGAGGAFDLGHVYRTIVSTTHGDELEGDHLIAESDHIEHEDGEDGSGSKCDGGTHGGGGQGGGGGGGGSGGGGGGPIF
jgi:uncharacterized membrane protein YgcG